MGHFACFLNRSLTDEFSPVFEIIYTTEGILLVLIMIILPVLTWIAANGVPLHKNLRCILVSAIVHGWIGAIGRAILLAGQIFSTASVEWNFALAGASFARRLFFMYFAVLFFGITVERLVATVSWLWYEKQGRGTLAVLILISITMEMESFAFAYQETFSESGKFEYASIVFVIFAMIVATSGIVYLILFLFNIREVAKLSCQGSDQYSLARSYQLRENVAVMKMVLRLAVPLGVICSPTFVFLGGFIFLPSQYIFFRQFSVAMFDLWLSVVTLISSLVFPLFEQRFIRSALRLRIYRLLITTRLRSGLGENVVKETRVATSDHYFDWLNRDLK